MPYQPANKGSNKKKPKKKGGALGFLGNLVDDVQEAGAGFIPGIVTMGKSVAHDAGVATGFSRGSYQTDDIINAIRKSYTDRGTFWGEAGRGVGALLGGDVDGWLAHGAKSRHALYENPLGPLLDAATLVTGGGAAVGKAGLMAAKGGSARGAAIAGVDPVTLQPLRRTVMNTTGGSFTKPVRRNPVTRARGDLFEAASHAFPDARIIGSNKRVGRAANKAVDRERAREIAQVQGRLRKAIAALGPVTHGLERKAVAIGAGNHSPAALLTMYRMRDDMLAKEIARKQSSPEPDFDPDTTVVIDETPDGEPSIRKTSTDEDINHDLDDPRDLSKLMEADRRESLRRNNKNRAFVQKRIAELEAIEKKGYLNNPSPKLKEAIEAARELSEITNARLSKITHGDEPDAEVIAALAEQQALRASLESRVMQQMGVVDEVYGGAIRSHVQVASDKLDTRNRRSGNKFKKPGKLDEAQANTGYNFFNGRDSLNPAMYLHTATNVFEHAARIQRHAKMMDLGQKMSRLAAMELVNKGTHRLVEPDAKIAKDMAETYAVLSDAEQVMAGTPGYRQLMDSLQRSVVNSKGDETQVYVLPTKTYDELASDFDASSEFIRRWVDKPTRVWRALTLNLRPAWIVNGFVGNLFLLANAYGVKGLKNYVLHSSTRVGKRGKWAQDSAPELTDMGWAHESQSDLKGIGQSMLADPDAGRIKKGLTRAFVTGPVAFTRAMGELNTFLADSAQRRAALISAIDPHVKTFRKSHPDMTWEEAATKLWENDDFSDEITQRVLDDMVDFGDLSAMERRYVKRAIPFIAWVKGATKVGANTVLNKPWNPAMGAALAEVANDETRERLGQDASAFMLGMVEGPGDRVIMTNALNPFMTPTDIFAMLSGSVLPNSSRGSQNPLSQFNPIFKAPGEALARKDFFFGKELDREGEKSLLGLTGQQALGSLAQKRLYDAIKNPNNDNPNRLYEQSAVNAILNYLGAPVRTLAK